MITSSKKSVSMHKKSKNSKHKYAVFTLFEYLLFVIRVVKRKPLNFS